MSFSLFKYPAMAVILVTIGLSTAVIVSLVYGWSVPITVEGFLVGYVATTFFWILFASYNLGQGLPEVKSSLLVRGVVLASSVSCLFYIVLKTSLENLPAYVYGGGITILVACVFSLAALMADKISNSIFGRLIKWYCIIGWPVFGFSVFNDLQDAFEHKKG